MKKIMLFCTLALMIGTGLAIAAEQEDIAKNPTCLYCSMDRAKFAHSRMLVKYDDGSELGACSVHCAAVDMALFIDKTPVYMGVGDYGTKKLIDAEKAYWVIVEGTPGVMTSRAKWAFEKQAEADAFIKANGGKAAGLEEVLQAAFADMYKDTKMIRDKRKKMREHQHQAPAKQ